MAVNNWFISIYLIIYTLAWTKKTNPSFFRSSEEANDEYGSRLSLSHSESLSSSHTSLTNNSRQSNNRSCTINIPNEFENGIVDNIEVIDDVPEISRPNDRDVTSAVVDHKGGLLVNDYWGVSLEIPENALPHGVRQEIYFVITDPRLCENAPPLDFENGIMINQCTYCRFT